MAKIFLTGVTGFLGSNIALFLVEQGHQVVATYRASSSKKLVEDIDDKIDWIIQDEQHEWVDKVIDTKPNIVIHSAWLGVGHQERDNWEIQSLNIDFLQKLLYITTASKADQFIGLGSQAEYGAYNGCVDEEHPLQPTEAYGSVKVICSEIVKQYCNYHKIDWYWLRLFSFFGNGESEKWLIPSLVKKMMHTDEMDLSGGEQKYFYLYVNDLGVAVNKIATIGGGSGIYNISGKKMVVLKSLIEKIRDKINSSFRLNFGKLPYRPNQPMHMQGDSSKFVTAFGEFEVSDFDSSLSKTIEDLKVKFNDQSK